MTDRRISIRFPPTVGPEETGRFARAAEEAGFDAVWASDSPLIGGGSYDPYVDLAVVAMNTKRVTLGPNVSPLHLRSPVGTAAAILSLDRISNGRAALGVSTGGSALVTLGLATGDKLRYVKGAAGRRQMLTDQVAFYRRLFAGEPVSLGAREIRLEGPRPIKVYVAASGPKALALAGAIGDGVIIHVGVHVPTLKNVIEEVKEGARAAGRDPEALEIICSARTAISPEGDRRKDIRTIKPLASMIYSLLPHLLERAGFDTTRRFPERMPYPDMTHAYDWEDAMEIADTYIPDEVAEAFCLVGPPDMAVKRIREMFAVGVTEVCVRGHDTYTLPHELLRTFGDRILPTLRP